MSHIDRKLYEKLQKDKSLFLNRTWISYGSDSFDPMKSIPIVIDTRCNFLNKPYGGLWASPADTEYGWKEWCEREDFRTDKLLTHFEFKLSQDAKIYVIDNKDDLITISTAGPNEMGQKHINYEMLLKKGYDGLFVTANAATAFHLFADFDILDLNAWDCESICIFNTDVVIPIKDVFS